MLTCSALIVFMVRYLFLPPEVPQIFIKPLSFPVLDTCTLVLLDEKCLVDALPISRIPWDYLLSVVLHRI